MTKAPDHTALAPYLECGMTLMPLFRWDRVTTLPSGKVRQDGKRPLDKDWTRRVYDSRSSVAHAENGGNVGVRLDASWLVVDVDPRNMPEGRDTLAELCRAVGLRPDDAPRVLTGSGGEHIYLRKPADVPIVDSLDGYPGVEFKTRGRQVVAAGSVHPNGRHYVWDDLSAPLSSAPDAPERLLALVRRPDRSAAATGGGEYSQEEVAQVLDALDPTDFREHGDWLSIMQACHHASGGEARSEFIEWCTRDPNYADEAWGIGRRWDSLHRRPPSGTAVTYRTLEKYARDAGRADVIPRLDPTDDFDVAVSLPGEDQDIMGELPAHERRGPLERMNDRLCAVLDGGKFRVYRLSEDPDTGRESWSAMGRTDFLSFMENISVEAWRRAPGRPRGAAKKEEAPKPKRGPGRPRKDGKEHPPKTKSEVDQDDLGLSTIAPPPAPEQDEGGGMHCVPVPIGPEWLRWPRRRTAESVVFDPQRSHPRYLNLWRGWGVDPAPGEWGYMLELISDVLCDGDTDAYEFAMNWMAYMVQKPWEPPGVAMCFHGGKGTGKSTLGNALVAIGGNHGMQVVSPELFTGRFNSHLMDVVVLFADEAVHPTDIASQGRLKAMVTERNMQYEAKGIDVRRGVNRAHVIMASNDDWFVPAGLVGGERRYFVCRVNNKRQEDINFFRRLNAQLYENGGLSAMLHDLQLRDIGNWAPRGNVPMTSALVDQKLRSMGPVSQWWFNILESGSLPFPADYDPIYEEWTAVYTDVRADFEDHCRRAGIRSSAMNRGIDRFFQGELAGVCPTVGLELRRPVPPDRVDVKVGADGMARCIGLPTLVNSRKAFEGVVGAAMQWATGPTDWS